MVEHVTRDCWLGRALMEQMNVVLENASNLEGANNKLNVKEVTWECPKHKIWRKKPKKGKWKRREWLLLDINSGLESWNRLTRLLSINWANDNKTAVLSWCTAWDSIRRRHLASDGGKRPHCSAPGGLSGCWWTARCFLGRRFAPGHLNHFKEID